MTSYEQAVQMILSFTEDDRARFRKIDTIEIPRLGDVVIENHDRYTTLEGLQDQIDQKQALGWSYIFYISKKGDEFKFSSFTLMAGDT